MYVGFLNSRFRSFLVLIVLIAGTSISLPGQPHLIPISASGGADKLPAGIETATIKPGQVALFSLDFTFSSSTVNKIFAYFTEDNVPEFAGINYNAASKVSATRILVQIRFLAAADAPGGTYPVKIDFHFLDFFGVEVASQSKEFDLIIDAPPPPDDHGDLCDTATPAMAPSVQGGHLTAGDVDFFRIDLDIPGTLTTFSTGEVNTLGTLHDDNCMPLLMDDDGGAGDNFRLSRGPLDPGTYYVSVKGSEMADFGDYFVAFEFAPFDPFIHYLYFPQAVNGTGFTSRLHLLGRGETTQARLVALGDDGNPLDFSFGVPDGSVIVPSGESSELETVPGNGLSVLQTNGFGTIVAGSLTVISDRPLDGSLVFGGDFGLAGVDPAKAVTGAIRLPVQRILAKQYNTGIALQNLEEHAISLSVQLLDKEGNLLATADSPNLPAKGHRALFVDDFNWDTAIDFENLDAILEVSSSNEDRFAATALLSRPGQLASLPVTPAAPPGQ